MLIKKNIGLWIICIFLAAIPSMGNAFSYGRLNQLFHPPDDPPFWPDTIRLSPATINASRLNVNNYSPGIYTLTPKEIKAIGGDNLGRLLSYSGLIHIKDYGPGNLMTATARGMPATHTQLEWNGLPVNSLSSGQTDFSLVPLSAHPDIVIYTGTQSPGGIKFSPGSVISIQTNGLLARKEHPEFEFERGSFGQYQLKTSLPFQSKTMGARIGALYSRAENDFPYTHPLDNKKLKRIDAGFHSLSLLTDGALKTGNHLLGLHLWTQNHFREIPRPVISVQLPGNEWMKQDAMRVALSDQWINGNIEGKTHLGYTYDFFHYRNLSGKINSSMATHQSLLNHHTALHLEKMTLQSNLRVIDQRAISANYANNPHRTLLQAGLSVNSQFTSRMKFQAHLGIEKASEMTLQLHPLLKIEVSPEKNKNFTAYLSAGKTSRIPSFNDLYWNPGGNPGLKPEKIFTVETGLRAGSPIFKHWQANIGLTLYHNHVKDWILWLPDSIGSYWSAINLGKVNSKGIELQAVLTHEPIQLKATAAINSVNEPGKSNHQLPYSPHLQASLLGLYQKGNFSFHTIAAYTSRRYLDSDNTSFLPGYWIADAGFAYTLMLSKHTFEINLNIRNLLNKEYEVVAWQPMPGRNFNLSIIYTLMK